MSIQKDGRRWVLAAAILGAALNTAACKDAGAPVVVARVQVSPTPVERVVGQYIQFHAQVLDADGNALTGRTIAWQSTNESVAAVDANGLVETLVPGIVVISAACEGMVGSATLNVLVVPVSQVSVTPPTVELLPGDTVLLTAVPMDSTGTPLLDRVTTWSSSNEAVARVDGKGLVTAYNVGTATVTAASETVQGTAEVTVLAPPDPCDPAYARLIGMGEVVDATLSTTDCPMESGGYYDLYRFSLTTSTTVQIDMHSTIFDSYACLIRGVAIVDCDDDSGSGYDSRITWTLNAGNYLVVATSWWEMLGSYQISLRTASAAERGEAATAAEEVGRKGSPPAWSRWRRGSRP